MYFDCEVLADVVQDVSVEEMKLNNGVVIKDVKLNKIMMFATYAVSVVSTATQTVSLPVTVDSYLCIVVLPTVQVGPSNMFCKNAHAKWTAVREKNAIIGNVSLEGVITIICCSLSIVGLFFRLAFQNIVAVYKSYPGKVQFSLCLSLLLSYMFFLLGGMVTEGSTECRIIGILTHMAFLSALFWMNVTAFEIWRTFRHWSHQVVSRGNTSLVVSSIYAVGTPAMIISGAVMVEELAPMSDFSPEYGVINCWLNGSLAVAVYFVIPCSALCFSNVIFVGLTLRGLRRQRTSISEFKFSSTLTAVNDTTIVVKISLLVGITWLLGLVAAAVDKQPLWIIFTIINASLGFFISVVLVLNKRVYLAVKARLSALGYHYHKSHTHTHTKYNEQHFHR
ncbi:hypothetical protein Btru_032467 [Bulinus truncatus]|nr:hypothetical protein Btru_032467 [Bulinus truncatus]